MPNPLHQTDVSTRQSKEMFGRVLSSWACDVLALKRSGLDRPCFRLGSWSGTQTLPFPDLKNNDRRADAA